MRTPSIGDLILFRSQFDNLKEDTQLGILIDCRNVHNRYAVMKILTADNRTQEFLSPDVLEILSSVQSRRLSKR